MLWRNDAEWPAVAHVLGRDLARLGIDVDLKISPPFDMYDACGDPTNHVAICNLGWVADYPSGTAFFESLYGPHPSSGGLNFSLLGATPGQLAKWGYGVRSVPDVRPRMERCKQQIGQLLVQCWASFDQYLTEQVVPTIPLFVDQFTNTYSRRVRSYGFDAEDGVAALEQIALRR
jgi:hypothetical protein